MNEREQILGLLEDKNYEELYPILEQYHPVDIAQLMEELSENESINLFSALEFDTALQVLEEIDSRKKYLILTSVEYNYARKLIQEMSADEVADLLGDLKEEEKRQILSLLEETEQTDLIDLLSYERNTAGGRMTTEYIAFPKELKAKDALNRLAELAIDAETIYYVYVVDSQGRAGRSSFTEGFNTSA